MKKLIFLLFIIYNICKTNSFYNNNFLYKIRKKNTILCNQKNNKTNKFSADIYLNTLSTKKKDKFNYLIKKINFDNILTYNKLIDVIYYTEILLNSTLNNNKIIIELKNKTRYYYEIKENESFLIDTILDYNDEIEYINFNDYPYYILNSPLGYLKEEK